MGKETQNMDEQWERRHSIGVSDGKRRQRVWVSEIKGTTEYG